MKSTFLKSAALLLTLIIQLSQATTKTPQIYLAQNISSQIVQERETIMIPLGDYFKGSLLDYELCLAPRNESEACIYQNMARYDPVDIEMRKMVKLVQPFNVLERQKINDSSYQYGLPPFPRSTYLMEDQDGTQIIYLVDRNYQFMRYDINNFTQKETKRIYSIPLDQHILNDTCTDLQRVSQLLDSYLLMFCTTVTFVNSTEGLSERTLVTTLVRFENLTGGQPIGIRYITYKEQSIQIDKNVPLISLGCEFAFFTSTFCQYLSITHVESKHGTGAVILRVDMREFDDMMAKGITWRILTDREPVDWKYWINVPEELETLPITDVELLAISYYSQNYPWLAVLIRGEYIVFCQYVYSETILAPGSRMNLDCRNGTIIRSQNLGSLFHNNRDRNYLYGTMISPPGILEIRVDDPLNAFIDRIYSVGEDTYKRYIGQPQMATNQNYILHLMEDISTQEQIIRVYDKNANYFSTAMFDYPLPRGTFPSYILFPNFYFDIMFYRDEEAINLVRMSENYLVLDATNSTRLHNVIRRGNNDVYVNLTAKNMLGDTMLNTGFNVTFVDKDDTQIYSVSKDLNSQKILLNCGDSAFKYIINGYFNGPNYELVPQDQADGGQCRNEECFFKFPRKEMRETYNTSFDFALCEQIFSLPTVGQAEYHVKGDLILICIDSFNQLIRSFTYDQQYKNLSDSFNVTIPNSIFLGAVIDMELRLLFLFTNATNGKDDSDKWITHKMVVHVFSVNNYVIWKSATTIVSTSDEQMMEFNTIARISYNTKAKRGVLVGRPYTDPATNVTSQMLSIFDVISQYPFVVERSSANLTISVDSLNVSLSTRIVKSDVSEEGFVYTLQEDNKMVVYEAFDYYVVFTLHTKVIKRWEEQFTELASNLTNFTTQIHDFDILEGNYILLYTGENETFVYEIEMQIYWQYKMVLPLYSQYEGYKYYSSSLNRHIVRSSVGRYLVILMAKFDKITDEPSEFQMFFYSFKSSQHDSLIMVQNVTRFFKSSSYQNVYLISDGQGEGSDITFLSDKTLSLNELNLKSTVVLDQDPELQRQLIMNCSKLSYQINKQGLIEDLGGVLTTIKIEPKTRFANSSILGEPKDQVVTLKVITQNQGLIPLPTQNTTVVKMSYAADWYPNNGNIPSLQNTIYMQELLDGYNLNYTIGCEYFNYTGGIEQCNVSQSIKDYTKSIPTYFQIEQVTSQNQILKSFSMNRLFLMLDTSQKLHILSLYDDDYILQEDGTHLVSDYQLTTIRSFRQDDVLGCNITQFADYYELYTENNTSLYLLIYQCSVNNKLTLKVSTMTVKNVNQTSVDPKIDQADMLTAIKNMSGEIQIALPVLDVEIYDYCRNSSTFKLIVTTLINGTFQNILTFYDAHLNISNSSVSFYTQPDWTMNCITVSMDTFMVQQILMIPGFGTNLALVALSDRGVLIIDTQTHSILMEYNIEQINPFPDQSSQQVGSLKVYSVAGDWPHSFHILSNYGLYIFTFKANLTDRAEVLSNPQVTLQAFNKRAVQLYFDKYNYELAQNSYGYAFLVTKVNSVSSFEVYLGGVSFNALQNSKILRMIPMSKDQNCISLTQEPFLASSNEDQIAVSFICNTQLYIVQLLLRPNIVTNMQSFNLSSRMISNYLQPATMQYGQFNISIQATNEYYTDGQSGMGKIEVLLDYEPEKGSLQVTYSLVYFAIILLFIIAFLSLMYLNFRMQEITIATKLESQQNFIRASKYSTRNTRYYKSSQRVPRQIRNSLRQSAREGFIPTNLLQMDSLPTTSPGGTRLSAGLPGSSNDNYLAQEDMDIMADQLGLSRRYNEALSPSRDEYSPRDLNQLLHLGVPHRPLLKSAMRHTSLRESDSGSMLSSRLKLDLTKFKKRDPYQIDLEEEMRESKRQRHTARFPEEVRGVRMSKNSQEMPIKRVLSGRAQRELVVITERPSEYNMTNRQKVPSLMLNETVSVRGSGEATLLNAQL